MSYKIYLTTENNYNNRTLKHWDRTDPDNITDYFEITNFNFNFNDSVNTELVVNFPEIQVQENLPQFNYAYYISTEGEEHETIISRWFIISQQQTRFNQIVYTLRRDVLVDFKDTVEQGLFNIDRAKLSDSNKLIYNSEGFSFNQIKKSQHILSDKSKVPWLCLFYSDQTKTDTGTSSTTTLDKDGNITSTSVATSTNTSSTYPNSFFNTYHSVASTEDYDVSIDMTYDEFVSTYSIGKAVFKSIDLSYLQYPVIYSINNPKHISFSLNVETGLCSYFEETSSNYDLETTDTFYSALKNKYQTINISENTKSAIYNLIKSKLPKVVENNKTEDILQYNDKVIRFSDGTVKKLTIKTIQKDTTVELNNPNLINGQLFGDNQDIFIEINHNSKNSYPCWTSYSYYLPYLNSVSFESGLRYKISSSFKGLQDSPYKMIFMPYPTGDLYIRDSQVSTCLNAKDYLQICQSILQQGGSYIYDCQIVPFCPDPKLTFTTNDAGITQIYKYGTNEINYSAIQNSLGITVAYMYIYDYSSNSGLITTDSEGNKLSDLFKITNVKQQNETDFLRICDCNGNNAWDFNYVKNGGVKGFYYYQTIKPYQSSITVQPVFNELYGANFEDRRGLNISSDLSITRVSDAWVSYVNSNKNYQNIFDRQIENLTTQNKYNNRNSILNSVSGALSGATSGATAGFFTTGNLVGGIVGGIAGGVASTLGGVADYNSQKKLQQETINYQTDIYNYQLDNIKAQANTISKVSGFDSLSKYYVFLEYYSCTDEEKNLFNRYIDFKGMKAGYIGPIEYKSGNVYTAVPIKLNEISENIYNAIGNELSKGVIIE